MNGIWYLYFGPGTLRDDAQLACSSCSASAANSKSFCVPCWYLQLPQHRFAGHLCGPRQESPFGITPLYTSAPMRDSGLQGREESFQRPARLEDV